MEHEKPAYQPPRGRCLNDDDLADVVGGAGGACQAGEGASGGSCSPGSHAAAGCLHGMTASGASGPCGAGNHVGFMD
jgi:hypothetical protein